MLAHQRGQIGISWFVVELKHLVNIIMLNKKISNVLACVGLLILCASSAVSTQAATSGQVRVRVVHASPDTPAADVYVNGVRAFKRLVFKDVSAYAALAAGSYRLQLVPAGKTLLQGPILISTTTKFEAGKDYTVIGQGLREDIAPLVLEDDNTLPDAKKAKVRFVHLSPDAPAVDVIVPATNNLKLFSGVAFQKVGDYATVDAGRYNLVVRLLARMPRSSA